MNSGTQGRVRPPGWLQVVASSARVQAQIAAQYRLNVALWGAVRLLQTLVYISVWRAVANATGGQTGGYTAEQFAGYFLCVLIVVEVTHTWVQWRVPQMIRTGELSPKLLRPSHPLLEFFGKMLAYNLALLVVLSPSILALWIVFDAQVQLSAGTAAAMLVVLPLATVTRYLSEALVGILGFWFTRIDSMRSLYVYVSLLLGGQFAPLSLLPGPMQDVARLLPFYWVLGFPVEAFTGRLSPGEVVFGVGALCAWGAVLLVVVRWSWNRGVRVYGAVGA